jgi:hypothetical protein
VEGFLLRELYLLLTLTAIVHIPNQSLVTNLTPTNETDDSYEIKVRKFISA